MTGAADSAEAAAAELLEQFSASCNFFSLLAVVRKKFWQKLLLKFS
jgi:hypothetical protein